MSKRKKNSFLLLKRNSLFFEVIFIPAKIIVLVHDFVVGNEGTWGTNWPTFSLQAQSKVCSKKQSRTESKSHDCLCKQ